MPRHATPQVKLLSITMLLVVAATTWVTPAGARGGEFRQIKSRHYVVHTDIRSTFAEQFAERLDNIHDEYARRLSGFGAVDGNGAPRAEVHLFERQFDFMQFLGEPNAHVAGVFVPSMNRLALYLHNRPSLNRTLQHEAFHQFAYNAISPAMPVWLNEGLAEYFEEALWTGERFLVGQVSPDRLRRLRDDIKNNRLIPFRQMMALSLEQWNRAAGTDAERATTQYNQAWAMVHFLAHAGNGTTPYRPHMLRMLKLLHEGKPAEQAFAEALSPNIEGFQARFVEYVATMRPNEEAMMLERIQILSHMLMLLHAQDVRFDKVDSLREAVTQAGLRLKYQKGTETFQTEADPVVYFQGPTGKLLPHERLYFAPRLHAPLPDLVCRWTDRLQFRAIFHRGIDGTIDHDIVPEGR